MRAINNDLSSYLITGSIYMIRTPEAIASTMDSLGIVGRHKECVCRMLEVKLKYDTPFPKARAIVAKVLGETAHLRGK